jgi:hypothetical protein
MYKPVKRKAASNPSERTMPWPKQKFEATTKNDPVGMERPCNPYRIDMELNWQSRN